MTAATWTVGDLRESIRTALEGIGLNVSSSFGGQAQAPVAMIYDPQVEYSSHATRTSDRILISVVVAVSAASIESAREQVDQYVGRSAVSVATAIEDIRISAHSNGFSVAKVSTQGEYGLVQVGGSELFGVEFVVELEGRRR